MAAARWREGIFESMYEGVRSPNLDSCMKGEGAPQARKLDNRDTDGHDITVSEHVANTKTTSVVLDAWFNLRLHDANAGKPSGR